MKNRVSTTLMLLLVLTSGTSSASSTMQPGAWKTTMTVMAARPGTERKVKVGESTNVVCFTKKFLASDPYLHPKVNEEKMRQKGADCNISDYARTGKKASWHMSCTARNGMQIESDFRVSVSGKSSMTTIHQTIGDGAKAVKSTTVAAGEYAGDCDSSMPRM
jgi:hypothetical protein